MEESNGTEVQENLTAIDTVSSLRDLRSGSSSNRTTSRKGRPMSSDNRDRSRPSTTGASQNILLGSDAQNKVAEASSVQIPSGQLPVLPRRTESKENVTRSRLTGSQRKSKAAPLPPTRETRATPSDRSPPKTSTGRAGSASSTRDSESPEIHAIDLSDQFAHFLTLKPVKPSQHPTSGFRGKSDTNPHHSLYKGTYEYQRKDVSSILRSPPRTAQLKTKPSTPLDF
jgi:hypothetical protein